MPSSAPPPHRAEGHQTHRTNWLRAAVLGANDGIVSVSGLVVGVIGSGSGRGIVLTSGIAGLIAGALSMAAGEYISVSSQRDSERSDLEREQRELVDFPDAELRELTEIYVRRGLDQRLAREVAEQLHERDAFAAHVRDELGLDPADLANPIIASSVSAAAFGFGAALPLVATAMTSGTSAWPVVGAALLALAVLGVAGARLGGAPPGRATVRVLAGGAAAMAVTWLIGHLLGVVGA